MKVYLENMKPSELSEMYCQKYRLTIPQELKCKECPIRNNIFTWAKYCPVETYLKIINGIELELHPTLKDI